MAIALGADGLEGPYEAELLTSSTHNSSYMKGNFFRLMVAVTKDEPDVDEIEQLVSMDASLSYGLLKMANSAYFALKQRATTIHQAIVTLGLGQLKQWVFLLSASTGEDGLNSEGEEFLKRSFMRANFCSELMNHAKNMPITKAEAYLMGMFSMLNHLIDAPMAEILGEIPVAEEIKTALLTREGRCGDLYELVLSYEAANWDKINYYAEKLGIPNRLLTNIYFLCMDNVNILWEQLTRVHADQTEETEQTS